MTEHGIECSNREEIEDDSFTEQWIKVINDYLKKYPLNDLFKYDYILIDEGQDFKGEWVRFLKQFFTGDGEILVVYDKAQDLYNHGLWIEDSEQIKNIGFRGVPGTLKYTERLPKEIVERIQGVCNALGIKEEEILLHQNEQISFMSNCKWYNYGANNLSDKLQQIEYVINDIQNNRGFSVALEDITILTTNEKTGSAIVKYFMGKGLNVAHVYDLAAQGNQKKRRNEKWKFVGGTGKLKVCSYHSYKGWQTPNILLVLDHPFTTYTSLGMIQVLNNDIGSVQEAIFMGLSRVKANAQNGQYSFICLNYINDFERLAMIFN